jgi:predicted O-linked N-acetylglucosamine transferase (SPINDLY family)
MVGYCSFETSDRCLFNVTSIFLRYIPESVRWLLAKGMNRTAVKIIKRAAQVNGAVLSHRLLSAFEDDKTTPSSVSSE